MRSLRLSQEVGFLDGAPLTTVIGIAPSDNLNQADHSGTEHKVTKKEDEHELRKLEEEKDQIRAEYQQVLKNSVAFEKRIRDRWRHKNRDKNQRIAELEAKVEELQRRLEED
jgi:hypothetical protein